MNLFGTAAIVTGGASGLGEAVVRALAAAGAKVSIFDQNEDLGLRVAGEMGGAFCKTDVTSEASVETAFARARDAHGQERVLVNCAGVSSAVKTAGHNKTSGLIEHFPLVKFDFVIQVNLIGTFRCIAKAAAGMLALEPIDQTERGVIVNTASVAAEDGQIGQAAYSASKGDIVAMTLPVARDLAGYGIRVNTILPGIFKTPMMRAVPMSVQRALGASVPFPKRLGEPHEFASLALEMIRNPYLNGEDVRLDGSLRMGPR